MNSPAAQVDSTAAMILDSIYDGVAQQLGAVTMADVISIITPILSRSYCTRELSRDEVKKIIALLCSLKDAFIYTAMRSKHRINDYGVIRFSGQLPIEIDYRDGGPLAYIGGSIQESKQSMSNYWVHGVQKR